MNATQRSVLSLSSIVAMSLLACSSAPSAPSSSDSAKAEDLGHVASPVIKGKNSDTSQDDVILLVHFDPTSNNVGACSGTLLSDRVILTARHCVADTDESAACDVSGTPLAQGAVRGNHPASTLYVFVGANRPDFNSGNVVPDGVGLKILDDGGTNLCNHDIAMVILKDPIKNAKIAQIRLDSPIIKTDVLTAVGWGVTDTTPEPMTRQQRSGIKIEGIGPDATTQLPLPPNEFQVGESICSGDSGGPAFAASNAIVGIVSRGGNNTQPDPNNPSATCIGAENIYTKVAPFKTFIVAGLASVGAEPWYEGGPDPRLAKPDAACAAASECRSNICVADPAQANAMACAQDCSTDPTACPDGQTCTTVDSAQICRTPAAIAATNDANSPKTVTTSSCSAAPAGRGGRDSRAFGLVLAALGLAALRRRRASK
jgi:MYXO-CTERM domain-containing protein